jgi:hypothetical protein
MEASKTKKERFEEKELLSSCCNNIWSYSWTIYLVPNLCLVSYYSHKKNLNHILLLAYIAQIYNSNTLIMKK